LDDINFQSTMCGRCRHDLRVPVTLAEARQWLERGGHVDVLCEAIPWPAEPDATNAFDKASFSNEGFLIVSPPREQLLAALPRRNLLTTRTRIDGRGHSFPIVVRRWKH
jgi:hypothetical protein